MRLVHINTPAYFQYELEEVSLSALLGLLKNSYVDARAVIRRDPHVALLAQILNDTPVYRAICSVLLEDVNIQDQATKTSRRTSAPALPAVELLSIAISRYSSLKASIRSTDSDVMLAPLHTLLLSPLQPSGLNILDILLLYIEEADDLPGHALYAARILRELCAVRPSLQSRMVELLRARRMVSRNSRGIRNVLNPGVVRYTVQDMVALEFNESDPIRLRGEAALVVLETLSDSIETDPAGNNLCFLLFGFKHTIDASGQLYDIDAPPTGFHQVLSILEQFIAAADPFQLQFSALIEPAFRLLQRLVSMDCIYSPAVLRFIRSMNLVQQLVTSPFLSTPLSQADDLPGHALYAARILRELCAVRPSLQSRMVELLRARRMVSRNSRGIRNVLNPGVVRYTVQDMVALGRSTASAGIRKLLFRFVST
ncbi:hypothetical protein ANCCAN_23603 [Ancylostoma caninum]|uniref:Uncharacterized protein n=1 Tax=Ancylostoma caninum TaxID=29170 RepID=A0A368FEQ5_ANCCA|nr:hypothetical protein ANCCAN_23603 [Ancylostoma caninum]